MNNKAAMCGLDARIALAIFGALSVITGASLYSAIQESKVTATITQIDEISKSIEAFMLDTGSDLKKIGRSYDSHGLVDGSGFINWKGPYISLSDDNYLYLDGLSSVGSRDTVYIKDAPTGAWVEPDLAGGCIASPCYYWIETKCYDLSLTKKIDLKLDYADDATNGKVHYRSSCSGAGYSIYIRGPQLLKQP